MRLTLRTLLAYLDDILEPEQTREIGAKLNESSLASSLVSRIREVMRRRRLTAPTLSGPGVGIDPNAVAEYLDNTLSPDGVADVEKICLESDVHLAEVAACHQILTLALGEPVDVPSQTRERMYALGPSAAKMSVTVAPAAAMTRSVSSSVLPSEALNDVLKQAEALSHNGQNGKSATRPAGGESFQQALPEYLRRRSPWKGIASFVGAVVVIGVWVFFAFKESPFQQSASKSPAPPSDKAGNDSGDGIAAREEEAAPAVADEEEGAEPKPPAVSSTWPRTTKVTSTTPAVRPDETVAVNGAANGVAKSVPSLPIDLPSPPEEAEEEEPPVVSFRRKSAPAAGKSAKVASAGNVKPAAPAEAEKPAAAPALPAMYASSEGITLHYVGREQGWFLLPRRSLIHASDFLAVPEPFDCALEFEEGRGLLSLIGGTAVHWLGARDSIPTAVDLRRGRIKATTIAGEDGKPLRVAVAMLDDLWQLSLKPGTTAGVELIPGEPAGFEEEPVKGNYEGGIFVASGEASIVDPFGRTVEIHGPGWLKLPVKPPAQRGDTSPERNPPLLTLPKWIGSQALSQASRSAAKMFEKAFKLDEAVDLSLPAVAADPNPIQSKMATDTLGLIEAYGPLVHVVQRTIHDEARRAAISALRIWLPRSPDNRELLKAELAQTYPPNDADVVYRLLWGFSQEDARDKAKSQQLLDWMADPDLSIRELAFTHVSRLTGKTHDYRASNKPQQLQPALRSWQQHITREGALLAPLKNDVGK
jgi:hypothetical protein